MTLNAQNPWTQLNSDIKILMLKADMRQQEFENFVIPFGGKINRKNRWVVLSNLVPWDFVRSHYQPSFESSQGAPSLNERIAFGALLIKEKLGEMVEQIVENPYLQYYNAGLKSLSIRR